MFILPAIHRNGSKRPGVHSTSTSERAMNKSTHECSILVKSGIHPDALYIEQKLHPDTGANDGWDSDYI